MSEKVYLNDQLIDARHAKVGVSNPALLHGVGLFETLRTYDGRPFRLQRHIERMKRSAKKLDMAVGHAIDQVPEAVQAVLDANNLTDARLRFTVTPPSPQHEDERPTLLVAAQATTGYPEELYQQGMAVFLCTQFRQSAHDPLAGHKTTSYLPRLMVLRNAQNRDCGEALWFTPANLLAEGCISNVFLIKKGKLTTPPLDTPILPGVTREAVLELAADNDIPAEESACTVNDLLDADEVFLTNAVMEVMPVTRIERRAIADEKVGPVTRRLAKLYRQLTGAD